MSFKGFFRNAVGLVNYKSLNMSRNFITKLEFTIVWCCFGLLFFIYLVFLFPSRYFLYVFHHF